MKMTNKLATTLMDCLASVAVSANMDKVTFDENGDPHLPPEEMEKVEKYTKQMFSNILEPWECLTGEEWEIEDNESEEGE